MYTKSLFFALNKKELFHEVILKSLCIHAHFTSLLAALAQGPAEGLVNDAELQGASISISVVDLVTGEVLDESGANQLLCPASVWKLFTTSAAVASLGSDFKFQTILAVDGKVRNDTLIGNVIIVGGGDPSLGSRFLGLSLAELLSRWTDALAAYGIAYVDGNIVANASHFQGLDLPGTRIWEDMGNYYGASISGLNINDNTYFVDFDVPDVPGEIAEIKAIRPEVPGLQIVSEVEASERHGDHAYIYGAPGSNKRTVRGTLPAGSRTYTVKGSLPSPPLFAANQLRLAMENRGIGINGRLILEEKTFREPATLKVVDRYASPPLSEMIKHINQKSDNLYAEALLVQMGAKSGKPTIEGGLEAMRSIIDQKFHISTRYFGYDGSGLSRFTAVSAQQVTSLLVSLRGQNYSVILDQLPVAGREGSMTYFGKNSHLDGNFKAKSGSMSGVKAYAGHMQAFSGRELGVAVIINNHGMSSVDIRKRIERYLLQLYNRY